ncbi:MAG: hypothetical protein KKE16_02665 [Firmicutes bacterium]|nr:hypothetical protein [Bacillota bacterium]
MNTKLLNKTLKEIKERLKLDYALNKGFVCPSCTIKMIEETYGLNAIGIYVRWFGEDQDQLPIAQLDKLYINHDFGKEESKFTQIEIVRILEKYYLVDWDYSDEKTILIKEKVR